MLGFQLAGLPKGAEGRRAVHAAHRRLVMLWHPDKHQGDSRCA
eukprot:gene23384-29279_t